MKVRTNVDPKPKKKNNVQSALGKSGETAGGFVPKGQTDEDRDAIYGNSPKKYAEYLKRKSVKKNPK